MKSETHLTLRHELLILESSGRHSFIELVIGELGLCECRDDLLKAEKSASTPFANRRCRLDSG